MPSVKVKENEPFDVALRRFKRSCEKAGVLSEVRRREFYEKPTSVRKRKAAAAVKRHMKKLQRESYWDCPAITKPAGCSLPSLFRRKTAFYFMLL